MRLQGKRILLGVTGSIAAYKAAHFTRLLVKEGAEVQIIMSTSALSFITPLTLATLSKKPVLVEFQNDGTGEWNNHVALGMWADLFVVAPLSANTLFKFAKGACDNLLTATYLSAKCPVMVAPAMDLDMYRHTAVKDNLQALRSYGNTILEAEEGELASGLHGEGRLMEPEHMVEHVLKHFQDLDMLAGKRFLVTTGPTYEAIDPVRFIGNHSSGKMGVAVAMEIAQKGGNVELVLGPGALEPSHANIQTHRVRSAEEMYEAAKKHHDEADCAVFAAAVADFAPLQPSDQKIKKDQAEMSIPLKRNRDIAGELGKVKRPGQVHVGFALETGEEEKNARSKLEKKNFDMIVLNSLRDEGAGFQHDTNKVTFFFKNGEKEQTGLLPKTEIAGLLVSHIRKLLAAVLLLLLCNPVSAQQLNFTVTINSDRANTQERDIFENMKAAFEQFLNGTNWIEDEFSPHERIKGNLLITINEMPQINLFNATVQVQTLRPVYGSNYESLLFNFADRNWTFEYVESQPLEFQRFSFVDNISSLLAFYAYIALGIDYDSFSPRGGDSIFEIANSIVSNAQQSSRPGWNQNPSERRNRYWLSNALYGSQAMVPVRDAYYLYHRQGMDLLAARPNEAYQNILEAIRKVSEANRAQPNSILTITFMDAKSDEISKVLKNASLEIRTEAVELLLQVDPNNARKYNEILKG